MQPLSVLFPLVFVALIGFICARFNLFSNEHFVGLRQFFFNLAIPTLLFISMYQADLSRVLSATVMISFYGPVLTVYILCTSLLKIIKKTPLADSAIFALGCTYSNTVLVGLPIIITSLGAQYGALVFIIITFHSAMLFALTFFCATEHKNNLVKLLKPLFINPIVLSISCGILANLLNIALPQPVQSALLLLAEPAIAGALFVLGASLVNYSIKHAWQPALLISLIKLIILPLAVYITARWGFKLDTTLISVVTLMSASPLGVNAYLVARQLNTQQAVMASSVALSTLLSIVTLSLWLTALVP
ncbi:AEC family transporter [Pseudoalteromonas sp. MMG013]|uniref:AEC family transporter n=1 Tax=Pseudoalteromonas sp. MMG013 TaxID=2822687 RepID=UPI001B35825B|nr:AEC family transporter [Pseudoalteromonas sp. MMG013]MBQ4861382.1 AEC family transporter [Pseudoalteromonas sp. MMG013]